MAALCPKLADPFGKIITSDNVNSLLLSSYSRDRGTTVNITCVGAPVWELDGPSTLTCLNTSQWDQDPPTCVYRGVCPELAVETFLITTDTLDWLYLSTYSRRVNTVVDISCLAQPAYVLQGASRLTCLSTGEWDHEKPTCVPAKEPVVDDGDMSMVPFIVSAAVVGLLVLTFVAIMVYINCCWKKKKCCGCCRSSPKPSSRRSIGLLRSLSADETEQDYNRRLRRGYPSSDESDVLESVSARNGPNPHYPNMPVRPAGNPLFHDNRGYRGDEPLHPPYITGRNHPRPDYHTSLGSGRSYRTWHDLFYA